MSNGMNKVFLLGNLGAEPELRFTAGGTATLSFRLATSDSYLDRDGVRQERTEWHRAVVFGKRAEALHHILRKGSAVLIEGRLHTSSYEKDGQKHYSTEVHVRELCLASSKPGARRESDELGSAKISLGAQDQPWGAPPAGPGPAATSARGPDRKPVALTA